MGRISDGSVISADLGVIALSRRDSVSNVVSRSLPSGTRSAIAPIAAPIGLLTLSGQHSGKEHPVFCPALSLGLPVQSAEGNSSPDLSELYAVGHANWLRVGDYGRKAILTGI